MRQFFFEIITKFLKKKKKKKKRKWYLWIIYALYTEYKHWYSSIHLTWNPTAVCFCNILTKTAKILKLSEKIRINHVILSIIHHISPKTYLIWIVARAQLKYLFFVQTRSISISDIILFLSMPVEMLISLWIRNSHVFHFNFVVVVVASIGWYPYSYGSTKE